MQPTTTFLLYLISYTLFFVFNQKSIKDGSQRLIDDNGDFTSKPKQLLYTHLIGAIWLGLVPMMILKDFFLDILINLQTIEIKNILLHIAFSLAYEINFYRLDSTRLKILKS